MRTNVFEYFARGELSNVELVQNQLFEQDSWAMSYNIQADFSPDFIPFMLITSLNVQSSNCLCVL